MIAVSSDWHQKPVGLNTGIRDWIEDCKAASLGIVLAGDILDIVIDGQKAYIGCQTVKDIAEALDGYPMDIIAGNHDPEAALREIFKPYPNIHIHRSLDLEDDGWHVEHGDRFSIDWSWLRPVYWWVADTMLRFFPRQWFWFCTRMGWRPSVYKVGARIGHSESQRYNELTGIIWARARQWAKEHGYRGIVIGHTHRAVNRIEGGLHFIDDGDLKDGSYALLKDKDGWLRWWGK